MRCHIADISLHLPHGWMDITRELPHGSPPTLCRGDLPLGVLQFITARGGDGVQPHFDRPALQSFLREFEQSHHFTPAATLTDFQSRTGGTFGTSSDYWRPHEFTRLWYVTDGENLALVTFITPGPEEATPAHALATELQEAHRIVESITF